MKDSIFVKQINKKQPEEWVSGLTNHNHPVGLQYGRSLRISRLNKTVFYSDEWLITAVDIPTKKTALLEREVNIRQPIRDFQICGEKEEFVVSVSRSMFWAHHLDYRHQRRRLVMDYGLGIDHDEDTACLAVGPESKFFAVSVMRGWKLTKIVLIFADLKKKRVNCKQEISFFRSKLSWISCLSFFQVTNNHLTLVGMTHDEASSLLVFDFDKSRTSLNELDELRTETRFDSPIKLIRFEGDSSRQEETGSSPGAVIAADRANQVMVLSVEAHEID